MLLADSLPQTAFEKSRLVQETLVKIQQSLRRMPGVSSAESNELVAQLQEVGQIISQETSQLVDAVMNLTLDQEDTDKAIARMGLEASLAKATIEDQAQAMRDLRADTAAEAQRRDQTERQSGGISSESRDEVIKVCQRLRFCHPDPVDCLTKVLPTIAGPRGYHPSPGGPG